MAQNENNSVDPQTTPTIEEVESKNEGEEGASSVDTDKNTDIDSNVANDDKETAKTKTETPEANKTENTENAPKAKQKEKKTKAKEAEKPAEKLVETPDVKAAEKTAVGNGPEDGAKLEEMCIRDRDITQPNGNMIIDIGGGTTDIAVISLGGIVVSKSIKVAGDNCDEAITKFIRKKFKMMIGERSSEELKVTIGCAYPLEEEQYMEVKGRNLMSGLPMNVVVSLSLIHI